MTSEEIVIPHEQAKTPPILPKENETETNPLERPQRSSSPEENCSICLNEFENKSFTDSCFHKFCFVCILEWSKVKAVCPLCKTSFKSIIHNIVSNEIYDQYHLQQNTPATEDQDGRRFRYRTTLTDDHRYAWQLRRSNALLHISREERRRYNELRLQNQRNAAYNYRRYIYAIGIRVKQTRWNRFSGYRDVSLDFFQRNPATVYRLVPWMQRDLSVIFNGDQNNVLFVTEFILSLIQRVDIQTPEFRNNLEGFLLSKTDHFVHEFINYARSPYDVETYDQMAQYNFSVDIDDPLPAHVISSDSDSDSDVILDLSSHSRVDIIPQTHNLSQTHNPLTHNPPPPVESVLNIAPGTSGASSNTQLVKQENDNTEIDVTNVSSDVEIIGYLKPYHERTPEVVVLSSDTEEEEQPTCRKCGQPKHASKCKKIKRKPKAARLYESYRRSSSSGDYRRSSRSRSRSRSRRKHSSRSTSREFETRSHSTNRSKTRKRPSKYNWIKSSSSSGNYSSDNEDYSKNQSNYSRSSKAFEKYQRLSTMKPYKSFLSRSYKHQRRSHRSHSRSVESRSRSKSVESRSHRSRSKSVESRSRRSRSKSHSRSHSISRTRPYQSPSRSYRSHSRSKSRSQDSYRSQSKSRSHDREPSWLDGHDKYHLKYRSGGKSSNFRNRESQKQHRISERRSPKNRYYRSSSRSKSLKKKHHSRSRSIEEVTVPTISVSHKRRSKEKQEARQRRREKRQLERRKKTANSKELVCIDLTESADEKADCREIMTQNLLVEEEVSTMNQSENDIFLAQTSGVGPMRAMLPDDIAQPQDDPSLDVVDDLLTRTDLQPLEPSKKTALDLLIEAEKIRLHGMLDKNDDGNFERDNEMN